MEKIFQNKGYENKAFLNRQNMNLGFNYSMDAENYKDSGDILINSALSGRIKNDKIIKQAIFLYRHAIELTLKAIIYTGILLEANELSEKEFKDSFGNTTNHLLNDLYKNAKKYIEKYLARDIRDNPKGLKIIEEGINEFDKIDERSTGTRYPANIFRKNNEKKQIDIFKVDRNLFGNNNEHYGVCLITLVENFDNFFNKLNGSFLVIYNIYESQDSRFELLPEKEWEKLRKK
ncbi:hypothetical protein NRK67_03390 [Fusobacteria bacterium ZRK30]|nr:hypothetical protein NRK67_03390 [Fusobacteria bacterium ZRK30]